MTEIGAEQKLMLEIGCLRFFPVWDLAGGSAKRLSRLEKRHSTCRCRVACVRHLPFFAPFKHMKPVRDGSARAAKKKLRHEFACRPFRRAPFTGDRVGWTFSAYRQV